MLMFVLSWAYLLSYYILYNKYKPQYGISHSSGPCRVKHQGFSKIGSENFWLGKLANRQKFSLAMKLPCGKIISGLSTHCRQWDPLAVWLTLPRNSFPPRYILQFLSKIQWDMKSNHKLHDKSRSIICWYISSVVLKNMISINQYCFRI